MDATLSVRDEEGRTSDVRGLFHRAGENIDDRMTFTAK